MPGFADCFLYLVFFKQVLSEVNLFDIDTSPNSYVPCEASLIKSHKAEDHTGTRVCP